MKREPKTRKASERRPSESYAMLCQLLSVFIWMVSVLVALVIHVVVCLYEGKSVFVFFVFMVIWRLY